MEKYYIRWLRLNSNSNEYIPIRHASNMDDGGGNPPINKKPNKTSFKKGIIPHNKKYSDEFANILVEEYKISTAVELSKKYNILEYTIRNIVNVRMKKPTSKEDLKYKLKHRRKKYSDEFVIQIKNDYKSMTRPELCKKYNLTLNQIDGIIRKN
jgi:Mor family transcriptional regulator